MNTKCTSHLLPSFAAVFALFLPSLSFAAVQVDGVSTTTDGAYGADASNSDLINAGATSLASGPTYSAAPHFGPAANNDGAVGGSNTSDITFWLNAPTLAEYSITYGLDTTVNTAGYDITSIQTINGWNGNSGNQKNQNYVVAVTTVGSATFTDIATVAYLPFGSGNTAGSTKVTVTEDTTGILATGVEQIRFTYTVPASGGSQPSPTIREIDVFGVPSGPDNAPPTLSGIADDQGGGPVAPDTPVTYTVTFSEDMDDTTVDASDFDNAGTSAVNFGTIAETSPGVFSVPVTPTTAGTLQLRIPVGATLSDAAGNALNTATAIIDDTTITVDTTPPTLAAGGINDDEAGGPVLQNMPLTYTVTFSEDMDDATVDASDFDNAGTATISIGAITEISPGVFSVSVTATTAGTLQLRVPLGASLSDVAGNPLDTSSPIVGDTIITVDPSSFVITMENTLGTPFASTAWAGNLSVTDLINAGQPTLNSATVSTPFFGPNGINDGAAGPNNTTQNSYFATGSLGNNFPATATYEFDVSTNTAGYDLTSIESFMGWHVNSGTHANQTYEVEVRLVGSPDYVSLVTVAYEPFGTENSEHHESHVVIEDSSGVLASGVDSIRFTFSAPAIGGNASGTVVREIDVYGTPTSAEIMLTVTANGGGLDFAWNSQAGKRYDLVSTTDPEAEPDPSLWAPYNDGVTIHEQIPSAGMSTTRTGVQLVGATRFFAVIGEDIPPLLSEGFEGGVLPAGWEASPASGDTIWNVGTPAGTNEPNAAASGTFCAGTNVNLGASPGNYTASASVSLKTPVLAIPAGGATLTYQQYLDTETSVSGDTGVINVLDADNSDALLGQIGGPFEGVSGPWLGAPSIDLSAHAGTNIKLEFVFTSDADADVWAGWYIDDVLVQ